jgi:hydrogenase maturation factor
MTEAGKASPEIIDGIILPRLGRKRNDVLIGPRHGVDAGIIDLGGDRVMAVTTDPFFILPACGWQRAAWFALHIVVSDAVTSGLPPAYLAIDLNLPLEAQPGELDMVWQTIHEECDRLGIAIVTGHTGHYEGCAYPTVGSATAMCTGLSRDYVSTTMARCGDTIIITKGAAIETAGLLAVVYPDLVAAAYGEDFARSCEGLFQQMSVVQDALTAVEAGVRDDGVTSMHDATEFGVWGGLVEIASASGTGLQIDKEKIILQDAVRQLCDLFEIDPYCTSSEGSLIITCRPHKAAEVIARLADMSIPASAVGEVVDADAGVQVFEAGKAHALEYPPVDPFWGAFSAAWSAAGREGPVGLSQTR